MEFREQIKNVLYNLFIHQSLSIFKYNNYNVYEQLKKIELNNSKLVQITAILVYNI